MIKWNQEIPSLIKFSVCCISIKLKLLHLAVQLSSRTVVLAWISSTIWAPHIHLTMIWFTPQPLLQTTTELTEIMKGSWYLLCYSWMTVDSQIILREVSERNTIMCPSLCWTWKFFVNRSNRPGWPVHFFDGWHWSCGAAGLPFTQCLHNCWGFEFNSLSTHSFLSELCSNSGLNQSIMKHAMDR
jgi:hypothetical protein